MIVQLSLTLRGLREICQLAAQRRSGRSLRVPYLIVRRTVSRLRWPVVHFVLHRRRWPVPTSVRLDPQTQRALEQLARSRSVSKSEILRQAIELLASQERESPFERVADLIGSVRG